MGQGPSAEDSLVEETALTLIRVCAAARRLPSVSPMLTSSLVPNRTGYAVPPSVSRPTPGTTTDMLLRDRSIARAAGDPLQYVMANSAPFVVDERLAGVLAPVPPNRSVLAFLASMCVSDPSSTGAFVVSLDTPSGLLGKEFKPKSLKTARAAYPHLPCLLLAMVRTVEAHVEATICSNPNTLIPFSPEIWLSRTHAAQGASVPRVPKFAASVGDDSDVPPHNVTFERAPPREGAQEQLTYEDVIRTCMLDGKTTAAKVLHAAYTHTFETKNKYVDAITKTSKGYAGAATVEELALLRAAPVKEFADSMKALARLTMSVACVSACAAWKCCTELPTAADVPPGMRVWADKGA